MCKAYTLKNFKLQRWMKELLNLCRYIMFIGYLKIVLKWWISYLLLKNKLSKTQWLQIVNIYYTCFMWVRNLGQLSCMAVAQGLLLGCSQDVSLPALIWRLDWGWKISFHSGSKTKLASADFWQRRPQFFTMWTPPQGCFRVLMKNGSWLPPQQMIWEGAKWKQLCLLWPAL